MQPYKNKNLMKRGDRKKWQKKLTKEKSILWY